LKSNGVQVYRRLLRYAWPYRWRILLSMIASLGVAGSDAAIARLVQPFIDRLIVAGDWRMAQLVPILVIGIASFKGLSRYIQEYFIKTSGQLVMQDIRNELYRHTVSLSMRFFSKNSSGTLMSRILNDVGIMQAAVAEVLVGMLREGMTLIALAAVAFYTDWRLAALAFFVIPASVGPASLIGRKIKNYSRQGQAAMGSLTTVLEQTFSGIKVIKTFGMEKQEGEKFRNKNRAYYSFLRKVFKYDAASSPLIEIISSLGVATVLWYGLSRVMEGSMTQGELFSVIAAILLMYTPVKRLTRINNAVQQAIGAAERVFEVLEQKPEVVEQPGAVDIGRSRGEVVFKGVNFAYDGEPVLRNLNLSASAGEVVALVGPSGAGKSTVAGLLCRFYDVSDGQISIDGHDIRSLDLDSLRQNLAMVDQETFLFNDTIANNIRFGCMQASQADVEEAARQAFADDFIEALPERYETPIGDRGVRLSGGQRQRLCIARALLRDAPILILDEATSALDTESEAKVQRALANLMKNRTTFVIAHRLSTIMHADKIVVLNNGAAEEIGTHQQLLMQGGLYRKLYDMQFQDAS
jgi:ATP-binding cassette, subfamily B, bacterial MsbA